MALPFTRFGAIDLALATAMAFAAITACVWYADRFPVLWAPAALVFVVWLVVVNFFRDPHREVPGGDRLVLSPADGVVTDITDLHEPTFLQEDATRLGIFLSPLDVHVNRMPMDCKVTRVIYTRGKMRRAYDPLAATENESCAAGIEVLDGRSRLVVRQVTGWLARRIVCPIQPGDRFRAGERYGMIKFGSRTEVWVPKSLPVTWSVKVGDRVKGGLTVLGVLEVPATERAP